MSQDLNERVFQAAARYILGESTGVKLRGNPQRVIAFQEVMVASRRLYRALEEGRDLSEVAVLVGKKHLAAEEFHLRTGLIWPL